MALVQLLFVLLLAVGRGVGGVAIGAVGGAACADIAVAVGGADAVVGGVACALVWLV